MENKQQNVNGISAAERIETLAADAASDIKARAEAFRARLGALRAEFCCEKAPEEAQAASSSVETVEYKAPELVRAAEAAVLTRRAKPTSERTNTSKPSPRSAVKQDPARLSARSAAKQDPARLSARSAESRSAWKEHKLDLIRALSDECVQELPQEFLQKLNGGVALTDRIKKHPESDPARPLLILGEYRTDPNLGRSIMLYGGSIIRAYGHLPEEQLKDELRRIIRHEFTHHIESLSGTRDLEIYDEIRLEEYRDGDPDKR